MITSLYCDDHTSLSTLNILINTQSKSPLILGEHSMNILVDIRTRVDFQLSTNVDQVSVEMSIKCQFGLGINQDVDGVFVEMLTEG